MRLYISGIRIASLWNKKAKLWLYGRRNTFQKISNDLKNETKPKLWMHCASLGEFEQGRPVLEACQKMYPRYAIVLTFFSPSGYEVRKNYKGADYIYYLPADTKHHARQFIELVNPELVLWVKYDYWYHYLTLLHNNKIPILLISGIFRPSQPFFKWYKKLWVKMLTSFRFLFVQNEASANLLAEIGITDQVIVNGDTRFDRVITIAEESKKIEVVEDFIAGRRCIVAGSTWPEDEFQWKHFVEQHPDISFIFAPHEVSPENIADLLEKFPGALRYSIAVQGINNSAEKNVLIIDNIGMLSALYKYATITYIGGGFNDSGIHNALEAAVYGKPIIFGPEYDKFFEAKGLIDCEAAFSISTPLQLEEIATSLLQDQNYREKCGVAAASFVQKNVGATKVIMDYIKVNSMIVYE